MLRYFASYLALISMCILPTRLDVHSTAFDETHFDTIYSCGFCDTCKAGTCQNSKAIGKTSEESWEQVAVPPDEARLAETPGGDSDDETEDDFKSMGSLTTESEAESDFESDDTQDAESDSEAYRGAFDASVSENDDDMPSPTVHGDAEGELEILSVDSGRIKLRRGITMDSGAAHNVMPRKMVRDKSQIRPSEGSKRGAHYVAANNGRIPNEGEYDFAFFTSEGVPETMTFQIAEVNKALGSISYLVDHGYRVVFDRNPVSGRDMSCMTHKESNKVSRFRRDRNVWVLDAAVGRDKITEAPFQRLG